MTVQIPFNQSVLLDDMPQFASEFAQLLRPGDVVCLSGEMGAGKTTFARLLVSDLFQGEDVGFSSPTFTVMNQYASENSPWRVHHVDLYRLDQFVDLETLDLFSEPEVSRVVTLMEWGEKFSELSDFFAWRLTFEHDPLNSERRHITVHKLRT